MNRRPPLLWIVAGAMALCLASTALAQTPNDALICPDESPVLDKYRYLRALSFDLRGTLPSGEEVKALSELPEGADVPEALLDEWLASDAFASQAVRKHRALLWNNVSDQRLVNDRQLVENRRPAWSVRQRANTYRRAPAELGQVYCLDQPAEFDENGEILTFEDDDGVMREGWVEVNPFWAPDTTIRVCAFDAQENAFSSDGTSCRSGAGFGKTDCGCGPGLIWCAPNRGAQILRGFGKSVELLIAESIREDRPYTELFETRRYWINGPMVHFYRYLAETAALSFYPMPVDLALLPDDIGWHDVDEWRVIELSPDQAGILTHPAFLLRFQTNRARASRYYDAFLCSPFQPPAGGLPPADDVAALNPDLQLRAGCKYCHSLLEPAASHWARWREAGGGFIDPTRFPLVREDCYECAHGNGRCSAECRSFYLTNTLTDQETPYLGMLRTQTFRRDEHMHHADQGPKLLMRSAVADNRMPRCMAQRSAEWLLGRDMTEKDSAWLDEVAMEFVQSGFSYQQLIKAIVTSDVYRRVQ